MCHANLFLDQPIYGDNSDFRKRLQALKASEKPFSDVCDKDEHQYVDLVMEGGGMLGLALLGYTWALEEAGIRFLSVAGTSAGAINALGLVAAIDKEAPAKPRSIRLLEDVADANMIDFLDGGLAARRAILNFSRGNTMRGLSYGVPVLLRVLKHLGLHPGEAFRQWVAKIIKNFGVNTTKDLDERLGAFEKKLNLKYRNREDAVDVDPRLIIIASEITTESRFEFPRMASLLTNKPEHLNPSIYLRASMSVPGVFEPYAWKLDAGFRQKESVKAQWASGNNVHYDGELPEEALFVDGGIISNFPIDVFHVEKGKRPTRPTFGVKLGASRDKPRTVNSILQLGTATFDTARHFHDFTYIRRNPDFKRVVQHIDNIDESIWLDFDMDLEAKQKLFNAGAEKALKFLEGFDWKDYQDLREALVDVESKDQTND